MIEVLHRSQAARVCSLDTDGGRLESPCIITYVPEGVGTSDGSMDGTLTVEGIERVLRLFGQDSRSSCRICPPGSSREVSEARSSEAMEGAALVRVPLPADLSSIKDKELVILENAFELRNDPRMMVSTILELREVIGDIPLIYAPGIADPSNLALLCYLGLDIFDDSLPHFKSRFGLTTTTAGDVIDMPTDDIMTFNKEEMLRELSLVKAYIRKGRLRELVDTRAPSSPWSVTVLRLFDEKGYDHMERLTPVIGDKLSCNTTQSLRRPEVLRFRRAILEGYRSPEHKRVLVLLPCSARKPYSTSKTHKMFASAIRTGDHDTLVHEVIVTSPLGAVPRELENFYPANAYDIPVTGEWKCEEKAFIRELVESVLGHGYDAVISHLGEGYEFVEDLTDMVRTVVGDPTSPASLTLLDRTLRELTSSMEPVSYQVDRTNTMRCILRHQFGEAGESIMEGAHVIGKYPYWKIFRGKEQLGMLTPERGMISLTLEGGESLRATGTKTVRIQDFMLKGNLFAVGVEDAEDSIRIGDEVVVCCGDEVRGVGVAMMPGPDMRLLSRGIAVKMRHRRK